MNVRRLVHAGTLCEWKKGRLVPWPILQRDSEVEAAK